MRILIAEDDFVSRKLLHALLSPWGCADLAVNGREAVTAFNAALDGGQPYDLVCLDIMMPELDGQQALAAMRAAEQQRGINALAGCKVIMTTALDDPKNVLTAFRSQAEAYLVKPIDAGKLAGHLAAFGFTRTARTA